MIKIKTSLSILLRIIEHNNRLSGHLFFYRLCGNVAVSILELSTKEGPHFSETCFRVKVLKTFKTSNDCHIKNIPICQTERYFKSPWYAFLEEPKVFLLALK